MVESVERSRGRLWVQSPATSNQTRKAIPLILMTALADAQHSLLGPAQWQDTVIE